LAQRALELDPSNTDPQKSVAWAQYRLGDSQACLATLGKITGDTSESDFIRTMAHQCLGNTSEARVAFDRGCQWSNAYIQKVYVDRWSRGLIWSPTAEMIRRLHAEAAEMLGVAESELSAVSDPLTATNDQ